MWFMIWLIQKLLKLNLNLIIRLMQPDSGEIRIDINWHKYTTNHWLQSWRDSQDI